MTHEQAEYITHELGNDGVPVYFRQKGAGDIAFAHLHADERPALESAKRMLETVDGRVISISHGTTRFVEFTLDGERYSFDPNRIFSLEGIRQTLLTKNRYTDIGNCSDAAIEAVAQFAQELLNGHLEDVKGIIAVHNNDDEGDYHAKLYMPNQQFGADAVAVYLDNDQRPNNFCFVTDRRMFFWLRERRWNVVLQHPEPRDDGSLSVYAAKHNIPYINVETHIEDGPLQLKMLEAAYHALTTGLP